MGLTISKWIIGTTEEVENKLVSDSDSSNSSKLSDEIFEDDKDWNSNRTYSFEIVEGYIDDKVRQSYNGENLLNNNLWEASESLVRYYDITERDNLNFKINQCRICKEKIYCMTIESNTIPICRYCQDFGIGLYN